MILRDLNLISLLMHFLANLEDKNGETGELNASGF
jgi:hypothetical protein